MAVRKMSGSLDYPVKPAPHDLTISIITHPQFIRDCYYSGFFTTIVQTCKINSVYKYLVDMLNCLVSSDIASLKYQRLLGFILPILNNIINICSIGALDFISALRPIHILKAQDPQRGQRNFPAFIIKSRK